METLSLPKKKKKKRRRALEGRSEIIYSKSFFTNATFTNNGIIWDCTCITSKDLNAYTTFSPRREGMAAPLKEAHSNCRQQRAVNRKNISKLETAPTLGLGSESLQPPVSDTHFQVRLRRLNSYSHKHKRQLSIHKSKESGDITSPFPMAVQNSTHL